MPIILEFLTFIPLLFPIMNADLFTQYCLLFSIGFCLLVALGAERLLLTLNPGENEEITNKIQVKRRRQRSSSQSSMSSESSKSGSKTSKIRRRLRELRRKRKRGCHKPKAKASTNVYFLALFLLSLALLCGLFTAKTWTRNYDWNSRRQLFG